MIEIKREDLCYVGSGDKIHIRYNEEFTYCSALACISLRDKNLISLTETSTELCHNCLREYKRRL